MSSFKVRHLLLPSSFFGTVSNYKNLYLLVEHPNSDSSLRRVGICVIYKYNGANDTEFDEC